MSFRTGLVVMIALIGSSASAQPASGRWWGSYTGIGIPGSLEFTLAGDSGTARYEPLGCAGRRMKFRMRTDSTLTYVERDAPGAPSGCGDSSRVVLRPVGACMQWSWSSLVDRWNERGFLVPGPLASKPRRTEGVLRTTDGLSLHYQVLGEGRPLFLLSGGPGNDAHYLDDVADNLAAGARVVLIERRGTGRSRGRAPDSTAMTIAREMADFDELRRQLGMEQVALVGHSNGGIMSLAYAAAFPDRVTSLTIIGAASLRFDYAAEVNRIISTRLSQADQDSIIALGRQRASNPSRTDSEVRRIRRAAYVSRPEFADSIHRLTGGFHSDVQTLLQADMRRSYDATRVASLKLPIHVVFGRDDIYPIERMVGFQKSLQQAQLTVIEKAGHFPWVENPRPFYESVHRFLCQPGR